MLGMSTSVKRQQPLRTVQNRTNVFFFVDAATTSPHFEHSRHLRDEAPAFRGLGLQTFTASSELRLNPTTGARV